MLFAYGRGLVEETPLGAWSDVLTLRARGHRTRHTWNYYSARVLELRHSCSGRGTGVVGVDLCA